MIDIKIRYNISKFYVMDQENIFSGQSDLILSMNWSNIIEQRQFINDRQFYWKIWPQSQLVQLFVDLIFFSMQFIFDVSIYRQRKLLKSQRLIKIKHFMLRLMILHRKKMLKSNWSEVIESVFLIKVTLIGGKVKFEARSVYFQQLTFGLYKFLFE